MKFMITFNHIEGVWESLSYEDRERHSGSLTDFMKKLKKEKNTELVFVSPPQETRTVRKLPSGDIEILEGPAISGPEMLGGYYIIDADSIEEAIDWAKKGRWLPGSNEVRQISTLDL